LAEVNGEGGKLIEKRFRSKSVELKADTAFYDKNFFQGT